MEENTSNNMNDFLRCVKNLLQACARFTDRVYDTGVEVLRQLVRDTRKECRKHITGLQGDSIIHSRNG